MAKFYLHLQLSLKTQSIIKIGVSLLYIMSILKPLRGKNGFLVLC